MYYEGTDKLYEQPVQAPTATTVKAEITLEIKIDGNHEDLNHCHPYCKFIGATPGGVMCRLFNIILVPDFTKQSTEFERCNRCISSQVEVKTWKEKPCTPKR